MFLECCVGSYSLHFVLFAVRYIWAAGGEGVWREPGQAACPYVSVTHFTSRFRLAEYAVHHLCSIINSAYYRYVSITFFSKMAFPVKQVRTLEEQLRIIEEVEKNPSEKKIDVAKQLSLP
jgi:hypothetical protein